MGSASRYLKPHPSASVGRVACPEAYEGGWVRVNLREEGACLIEDQVDLELTFRIEFVAD